MKISRTRSHHRILSAIPLAVIALLMLPNLAMASPQEDERRVEQTQTQESTPAFESIQLQEGSGDAVKRMTEEFCKLNGVQLIASEELGSMILVGAPENLATVRAFIKEVMKKANAAEPGVIRAYELANLNAKRGNAMLQTILAGRGNVRMDFDEKANNIIVYADEETQTIVSDLLRRLDEEQTKPASANVYVSLTLIVETSQANESLAAKMEEPSDKIMGILKEATEKGIFVFTNPRVAAHSVSLVNTESGEHSKQDDDKAGAGNFRSSSLSASQYQVNQHGVLSARSDGQLRLQTDIEVDAPDSASSQKIDTVVVAPLNHPVVLTFTSMNGVDAALIIKFVSAD